MEDPSFIESIEPDKDNIGNAASNAADVNLEEDLPPHAEFIQREQPETYVTLPSTGRDYRLYLPKHSGWIAVIKQSWEQEHCYAKNPGEDWFHLLANGEIYVQRGAEKYCLTCALRHKILTRNRLFWQKGARPLADD